MLVKKKNYPVFVYTWDWKDVPNFNLLFKTVKEKNIIEPNFIEVETGSDQLCIIFSEKTTTFTQEDAKTLYVSYYNDSLDENGVWQVIE